MFLDSTKNFLNNFFSKKITDLAIRELPEKGLIIKLCRFFALYLETSNLKS